MDDYPELYGIYNFGLQTIETSETTVAHGVKSIHAQVKPDRFETALRLYRIPDVYGERQPRIEVHDALDAYEWAWVVAHALKDAPHEATRKIRERRAREESERTLNEIRQLIEGTG